MFAVQFANYLSGRAALGRGDFGAEVGVPDHGVVDVVDWSGWHEFLMLWRGKRVGERVAERWLEGGC